MAQKRMTRRVTETLAEATGRSGDELRLALTGAAIAAGLLAALRLTKVLADHGTDVFNHPKNAIRVPRPRTPQLDAAVPDRGDAPA